MIIDGEHEMDGDEADFMIMYKAQRARRAMNVYFKGQSIWVGGRRQWQGVVPHDPLACGPCWVELRHTGRATSPTPAEPK